MVPGRKEHRDGSRARLNPEQAAQIRVPVLLITGENSPDPTKPHAEALADALPDARIAVIEGHEHRGGRLRSGGFQ